MNLLIKFPTRERRTKFLTTLGIYQRTKTLEGTRFLITLDSNDRDMNNESCKSMINLWGNMDVVFGESRNKVEACNRDLDAYDKPWDIVLLASDDMIPRVKGYDQRIVTDMERFFPDTDGVIFYYDGFTPLNTLCVIGRKYYDRFNYIYNPCYSSLWCDNEFMNVADIMGKQVFINETIIAHEHYSNGTGSMDRLMRKNESFYHKDLKTYQIRKAKNFGITT